MCVAQKWLCCKWYSNGAESTKVIKYLSWNFIHIENSHWTYFQHCALLHSYIVKTSLFLAMQHPLLCTEEGEQKNVKEQMDRYHLWSSNVFDFISFQFHGFFSASTNSSIQNRMNNWLIHNLLHCKLSVMGTHYTQTNDNPLNIERIFSF